jgi:hypothetical protein
LERNTRENKRNDSSAYMRTSESVSVHADVQSGEAKSSSGSLPPVSKDDLDIPTFLRNRR